MKTITTIVIMLGLASCVTMPERHVIKEKYIEKPVKSLPKDQRDRIMDCVARFHKMGKKHINQMDVCKFAFGRD